jgi:tetratricopeptide (TPR) repeat protein
MEFEMIVHRIGMTCLAWMLSGVFGLGQETPEFAAARGTSVAAAVYNVVPMPKSEAVRRKDFAEDLAEAFLAGEGERVDRLLAPYAVQPRAAISREFLLGMCHLASGDRQRGMSALEQASVLTPNYPEIFIELGRHAFNEKRYADALAQFEKAERLADQGHWPLYLQDHFESRCLDGFANVALVQGRTEQAMQFLRDLERRLPDDPSVLKRLGETAFRLQDYDAARKYIKDYSALTPGLAPVDVQLAAMAIRARQYDEARVFLEQASARHRDDPATLMAMTQLAVDMDDVDRALRLIAQAKRNGTLDESMTLLEGQARYMASDFDVATQLFEELSRNQPLHVGYSNLYALALATDSELSKRSLARQIALRNLRANPQQLSVLSVAGWLEYSVGSKLNGGKLMARLEQEISAAGVSIDRDTAFFLASYQSDQGRVADAISLLENALNAHGLFLHKRQAEELLNRLKQSSGRSR